MEAIHTVIWEERTIKLSRKFLSRITGKYHVKWRIINVCLLIDLNWMDFAINCEVFFYRYPDETWEQHAINPNFNDYHQLNNVLMLWPLFSCEEAALEVQMSLCPSVCLCVTKLKFNLWIEECTGDGHYKSEECYGDRHYKWEDCTGDITSVQGTDITIQWEDCTGDRHHKCTGEGHYNLEECTGDRHCRGRTLQVRGMYRGKDIIRERNIQGKDITS